MYLRAGLIKGLGSFIMSVPSSECYMSEVLMYTWLRTGSSDKYGGGAGRVVVYENKR